MIHDFYNIFLPQSCLILFILIELVMSFFTNIKKYNLARPISAFGICIAVLLLTSVQTEPQYFGFFNSVMSDNYTLLFHFMILLCGFFVVLLSKNIDQKLKKSGYMFQALLLTAILGGMCVVSSNDFITLFVSLEVLSFSTYFLIASTKDYFSKEASFKYLITTAVSTGVFLFGVSYLYGVSGSLDLNEIYEIIINKPHSMLFSFSGILIVLGLIAKLALFPFANWVIDVYKGTETSVLAYLSTIPKLALFGIICRMIVFPLGRTVELTFVLCFIALITALWANTYAIREKNVKAIFACSSAANASYVMLTASLVSVYNLSTVIFYLVSYVIINICAFSFLNIVESNNLGFNLDKFKGLFKTNFGISIAYVISILALAGFPLTSGFVAKIYLFSAIAHSGLIFIPFLFA